MLAMAHAMAVLCASIRRVLTRLSGMREKLPAFEHTYNPQPMSQITRCPFCATTFKVVADQLRISEGWVRCGQCKEVFDASEHLLVGEHEPLLPEASVHDAQAPAEPAAERQEGVSVWGSARGAAAAAVSEESGPQSDAASQPAQAAIASLVANPMEADAAADEVDRPEGTRPVVDSQAPTPLSSLLKREAQPELPADLPGYELPGASIDDSSWPQDAVEDVAQVEAEASSQGVAGGEPQQEDTESPSEDGDAPAEQSSVLQSLESLSSEPIPAEEAVVLPVEALLEGAPADAAVPVAEPGFVMAARRSAFWRRPWVRGALALAVLGLILVLGLQVAVQERDAIAARSPAAQALMEQVCQVMQCTLQAPRRIDAVVIDSSSFVKAREAAAAYQLQVGIKNTSALAVAMPALELTLTDAHEQTLLRRVLLRDELGAPAQLAPGAVWSATLPVHVMQDASLVAGYRLLAFYP